MLRLLHTPADCKEIISLINSNDAVHVTDVNNKIIFSKNSSKKLIPASTIKVLTSLSAFHYLGEKFRFKTEFYLNNNDDLIIKGYGDPMLISEVIINITDQLASNNLITSIKINNIILDNSYFNDEPVPGSIADSSEPYDAQTGALCVNFNTVNFYHNKDGKLQSAEEQTPLLPFVIKRVQKSNLRHGRIILTKTEKELYPGHLFKYFLIKKGVKINGIIKTGKIELKSCKLIYTYHSQFIMSDLVSKLLEFSNNFIANQIFLAIGAKKYGAPATLSKGIQATRLYTDELSKIDIRVKDYLLSEGSGLSRKNKISADSMDILLKSFQQYRNLMRKGENEYYKTGTLTGISTRIGYIIIKNRATYRYVILCNSPKSSSKKILDNIIYNLQHRIFP